MSKLGGRIKLSRLTFKIIITDEGVGWRGMAISSDRDAPRELCTYSAEGDCVCPDGVKNDNAAGSEGRTKHKGSAADFLLSGATCAHFQYARRHTVRIQDTIGPC